MAHPRTRSPSRSGRIDSLQQVVGNNREDIPMNPNKLSVEQLTGQATDLLAPLDGDIVLHRDVIPPYLNLRQLAAKRGIDLRVASGYRSFDRQRHIWNCKVSGQRPVLDTDSTPLD